MRRGERFDHAAVVAARVEGAGIHELVERFGIVKGTVWKVLRNAADTPEQKAAREAADYVPLMPPIDIDPFAVPMPLGKTYRTKELYLLLQNIIEQFGSQDRFCRATGLTNTDAHRIANGVQMPIKAPEIMGLEWRPFKAAFEQVSAPRVYLRDAEIVRLEAEIATLQGLAPRKRGGSRIERKPRGDMSVALKQIEALRGKLSLVQEQNIRLNREAKQAVPQTLQPPEPEPSLSSRHDRSLEERVEALEFNFTRIMAYLTSSSRRSA